MTTSLTKPTPTSVIPPSRHLRGTGTPGGLMIVSDYPTELEESKNTCPIGIPRRLVEQVLMQAGNTLPTYWTAACKEAYPVEKGPTIKKAQVWARILVEEIRSVNPKKILFLGQIGLSILSQSTKMLPMTDIRGRLYAWKKKSDPENPIIACTTYNPYKVLRDTDLFRDFSADICRLIRESKPFELPQINTTIVETLDELDSYLAWLEKREALISCDLETTGFDPRTDWIESIGFGTPFENGFESVIIPRNVLCAWEEVIVESKVIPEITSDSASTALVPCEVVTVVKERRRIYREDVRQRLATFAQRYPGTMIFHNGKFDLGFLEVYAGSWPCGFTDTLILHYALDERPIGRYQSHGLKTLARVRFDADNYAIDFDDFYAITEAERDYQALYKYHGLDLYYTRMLYEQLIKEMQAESPRLVTLCNDLLLPATQAFAQIELAGVLVDRDYLTENAKLYERLISKVRAEIDEFTGGTSLNPFSAAQVEKYLREVLHLDLAKSAYAHGDRSDFLSEDDTGGFTRRDALEKLAATLEQKGQKRVSHFISNIVEIRKLHKFWNTYFNALLEQSAKDGRIHPEFRLAGTATGRLSCAEPNLQNIPARVGSLVKDAFIAGPGNIFVQADYAQLELRVLAYLSNDKNMCQLFRENIDLHRRTASRVFAKPPEQIDKHERHLAKNVMFGIIYQRGPKSLSEGVEMDLFVSQGGKRKSVEEMRTFIEETLNAYPQAKQWIAAIQESTLKNQYVESYFGRRRRYPLIMRTNNSMIATIRRQAVNAPIQSMASDLCLAALVRIHSRLPQGAAIRIGVHDSILLECREEQQDEVISILREEMTQNHGLEDRLPFDISIEVGKRWGSMEEIK